MIMAVLFLFPEDIDECLDDDTHDCDGICKNEEPGYGCSCDAGYDLANDQRTCVGTCRIINPVFDKHIQQHYWNEFLRTKPIPQKNQNKQTNNNETFSQFVLK